MGKTSIEWTDRSWNPIRAVDPASGKVGWHCVHFGPECLHCYAESQNLRNMTMGTGLPYSKASAAISYLDVEQLRGILDLKGAHKIFPCSMTDWCGEFVPYEDSFAILKAASLCPQHTFLFLTKRPERMLELLQRQDASDRAKAAEVFGCSAPVRPARNLWLGTSAGTQGTWDRCAEPMRAIAALGFHTWISIEPLLEEVDWRVAENDRIEWVVIGGESGTQARPLLLPAMRSAAHQWGRAGTAVFIKQLGRKPAGAWLAENEPIGTPTRWHLVNAKGSEPSEWPADLRVRNYPRAPEDAK